MAHGASMSARVAGVAALVLVVGCGARQGLDTVADPSVGGTAETVKATSSPTAAAAGCPASIDFHDGTSGGLVLGPANQVLSAPAVELAPATNFESQVVFGNPHLAMKADFAAQILASDPSTRMGVLAELSILPAGCVPRGLAGRTVTVTVLWKLDGAIVEVPYHGLSLGGTDDIGGRWSFSDADILCEADNCDTRTLNTLEAIQLTHVFSMADDATDDYANGLYLRAQLFTDEGPTPTTVYVGSITWR
jgi:hypothetical protein